MTISPPGYLDTREAAFRVGRRPHTLECWRSDGVGPSFTRFPNGRVYYQPEMIDLWMRGGDVR